jgi:hypothetical protein
MKLKEAVVRCHEDADTGAVEEGHLGEVEADDPAPCGLLLFEEFGERFLAARSSSPTARMVARSGSRSTTLN